MDLKIADRNSPADRLALASMIVCFLTTGALLIGTLAVGPIEQYRNAPIQSTSNTH